MPEYANPLDNFRSSSYHFILTVANTTEALRKMIDNTSTNSSYLQAVNQAELGGEIDLNGEKGYLLIDTRRFSQFSVSKFEMEHIYGTGSIQNPSVPSALSKMQVLDTTGVAFFNFLVDTLHNKVQSTRASAFFMLSIVFVGHDDTNPQQTSTVATCFIPMILTSIDFTVTASGSIYDIEFQEVEGNPGSAVPQLVDLGDIQAISTEKTSNTLGGMIQALEDRLNLRSLQFYQKYSNSALKMANDAQQKNFTSAGKLVQYMITVPAEWRDFAINTAGKSENVEQIFIKATTAQTAASTPVTTTNDSTTKRTSHHSFSPTTPIPDAIKIIMEACREYLELASKKRAQEGTAVTHHTIISVTSDANTYIVHFDVYPVKVAKITDGKTIPTGDASRNNQALPNAEIRNLITYDYIFSGKNSHVLDLNIHFSPASAVALDFDLDMGQARLASTASSGQKPDAIQETGINKTEGFNPLIRPGEPLFIPMKTKDQQNDFASLSTEEFNKEEANKHIKAKQEYTATIASLHFVGAMDTELVIRGNPNLIRKYADRNVRGGVPKHPAVVSSASELKALINQGQDSAEQFFNDRLKGMITSEKNQYYNSFVKPRIDDALASTTGLNDALLHGPDVSVGPLYIKINIYTPNVDYQSNAVAGPAFTNKFFYTGPYQVLGITTMFDSGQFKHTIRAIPYDVDGSFSRSATSSQTESPRGVI